MPDRHPPWGGRREPVPPRARTLGVAGVLFCLAAALLAWAGHSLARTPSDRAVAAPDVPAVARSQPVRPADERPSGAGPAARTDRQPVPPPIQAPDPAVAVPDPERVVIPALGLDQALVELAVVGTSLQVPQDYSDVGWWSGGAAPGEQGAAVLVGHVDSLTGPAVFYGLSELRTGDRVRVSRDDGSRLTFAVRRTAVYDRDEVPAGRVYRTQGRPSLHLLTCGGTFDEESGQYSDNVVVFAELVDRSG